MLMTEKTIPIHAVPDRAPEEIFRGGDRSSMALSVRNELTHSQRKLQKRIIRLTAEAIADFRMIEEGDRILVAMSGGKDSYVLLDALLTLQKRAPVHFELLAVNVDQHIPGFDKEALENHLKAIGVSYHLEDQDTNSIVERLIPEGKNVCSLCARLRRGILYRIAQEKQCTKIALGHHMDDMVGTLLLNLFYGGRMKGMPPKLRSDDRRNIVIRPLAYLREYETEKYARIQNFPIAAKGMCKAGENLKRREIKALIRSWDREFPGRIYNIFMSMKRVSPSQLMDPSLWDFDRFERVSRRAEASPSERENEDDPTA